MTRAAFIPIILLIIACMSPLPCNTHINNYRIVFSPSELMNLKIAEAITIKMIKPLINVKFN